MNSRAFLLVSGWVALALPVFAAAPVITLNAPADNATGLGAATLLDATATDADGQAMAVTFFGRETPPAIPGPDFLFGTLPDTQYYSQNTGGIISFFNAQTDWYAANRVAQNLAFVSHMGDFVQTATTTAEWQRADGAMARLENPATTGLADGIPWGGAPGNHDVVTGNLPAPGFNTYFGQSRFAGRAYYQGNLGSTNDNNYQFFSASGLDFIVIHLTYRPTDAQIAWADDLIAAYPERRAIVTSHELIEIGTPATGGGAWRARGLALYNAIRDNPNLFLMLCGHVHGEGMRTDTFSINGVPHTVTTVLQDFQGGANGGNGFFRLYRFSPANDTIFSETYSPSLGRAVNASDGFPGWMAPFAIPYDMGGALTEWIPLGSVNVPAGGTSAILPWTGLDPGSEYEWFVEASDGGNTTTSAVRRFATVAGQAPMISLDAPLDGATFLDPANVSLTATASDVGGSITLVEFYQGTTRLGDDATAPYTFAWNNVASGDYTLSAVAIDNHGFTKVSNLVDVTVLPAGGGTINFAENFDAMGTTGTTPPAGWSLKNAAGGNGALWASSIPASGTNSVADMVNAAGNLTVATAPTGSNNNGYNAAISGATANRILATSPTTNAGSAIQLQLLNNTPGAIAQITLGYDIRRFNATSAEQLPGYRLFYSLDGGVTWTNVAALNPTGSGPGGVVVPNTAGVTTVAPTAVPLGAPWASATNLLLRWVDDNADGFSDPVLGLDNVTLTAVSSGGGGNTPPTVSITAPTAGAVFTAPASIVIDATAADTDGTVTQVEFFHGTTSLEVDSTSPFSVTWNGAPAGNYALTAVATDDDGAVTTSTPVNLIVNPAGGGGGFSFAENFNAMGTTTVLPAGWSIKNGASGSTNNSWVASIPAAGTASVADMVNAAGAPTASNAPTGNQNNGYNAGAPGNAADRLIATAPTSNAGSAIQLALTNTSGVAIAQLTVGYDIRRFTAVAANETEDLPGYQLFASLDAGATWSNVANLNPTLSGPGGVIVPNSIGVTTVAPTTFPLPGPWAAGATLLLRWVDDNATDPSPDQIIGLDNVTITAPASGGPAPVIDSALVAGGTYQTAFTYQITATNTPTSFDATGLPAGLSVDSETGEISGAPTETGLFVVELAAANAGGTGLADLELSIAPAGQTIAFGSLPDRTLGTAPFAISATASSGLTVAFTIESGPATIASNVVTLTGAGAVTIRATQPGNANFSAAPPVDRTFAVTAVAPIVAIAAPADGTVFGAPASFTVTATANGVDDDIAHVEFFRDATSLGVDFTNAYTVDVSDLGVGVYVFTAVATDTQGLFTTSAGVTITVVVDTDGDGLPNAWELDHGLDPDDPDDAALDPDGDGRMSGDEYLFGTDPQDPTSHTILRSLVATGVGEYTVTFDTIPDRLYTLYRSGDLVTWVAVPGVINVPGTGAPIAHPDQPGAGLRWFYRIEVRMPAP